MPSVVELPEARASDEAVRVSILEPAQNERWDAFVTAHERASIYHQSKWRELIESEFRHQTYYLWARRAEEVVGVLPLVRLKSALFGDYMVSVPFLNYGGALGCDRQIEDLLMHHAVELALERGIKHIEFRDECERDAPWHARTDKVTMELELPATPEALWQSVGTKKRTRIRRPGKAGARAIHGGAELVDSFYTVFSRNMRDLGTPVYSRRLFERILDAFADEASITVVMLDEEPVAAAFLIASGTRMEIPWASALREHNRLAVNMFLYWEVLKRAIEQGMKVFDFGRSSVGAGTYEFKKQWGALERQLYWHYWLGDADALPNLTPNNPKYRLAIRAWQHLPMPVANTLGPLVVRNLP